MLRGKHPQERGKPRSGRDRLVSELKGSIYSVLSKEAH